ncbi:diaminopimelate decarboxylase [Methanococcus maripaludis]|uniref:Diaminopimelate decarboxylase n=1 Tax=Methanococcus maripaludis TaxID=39152 RepID=A0A7J9S7E6_METMI|nr:decarboxylase [Methanococcus maripaludis]MBB6400908.1 diaminopimelate decarboxylase [Methanococcus maripaludis]
MELNWDFLNKLTEDFGDSYYLLDSNKFIKNYDEFLAEFQKIYPNTVIAYSYKTNYLPQLCSIVNEKGGYAEVVSKMEYDLAIKIGVSPSNIIVNGPLKTKEHLEHFLLNGSTVNVDSCRELELCKEIAKSNPDKILSVGLRCNFEINSTVSRFGFDVRDEEFIEKFKELKKIDNLIIKGIHCHFPDRNLESYSKRVDILISILDLLFKGDIPEFVDIGGGYFGKIDDFLAKQFNCNVPSYSDYADIIASRFKEYFKNLPENKKPKLILEPGTALVADTMKFIAKVIEIKNIQGKNIAMTTGSKFNMGLFGLNINLPINVYSEFKNEEYIKDIDISGYTCIEADYLFKNYSGVLNIGDYIAFDNIGSYSFVFKPPFICPNVPIIDYNDGNFKVVKRRETFEDIFKTYMFK